MHKPKKCVIYRVTFVYKKKMVFYFVKDILMHL